MGNKINHSLCGIITTLLMLMASVDTQQKVLEESSPPSSLQEAGARLQHSPRPVDDPGPFKCTQQGCLRCERVGCVKCKGVIVLGTRECLEECPTSHHEDWSTLVDYMGRLCTESSSSGWLGGSTAGLGGRGLAVLVGAASGVAICLLFLMAGCAWVAYSRGKARRAPTSSPLDICSVYDEALVGNRASRTDHWLSPQELQERREFAKQVAVLRPDAPVFLAMLNDTRRKVRQLYRPNGTDSRSKAYRTVLRDLSRLLTLLNRPEGRLGAPPQDWSKLQAWAERSLRRYKKSCGGSSEGGSGVGSACSSGAASSASSTPSSSHALNQHQLPPEVHPTHSILQLPLPPDCGLRDPRHGEVIEVPALLQTSEQWSQSALINGLYYESFYPLGLRPQDEITTEL